MNDSAGLISLNLCRALPQVAAGGQLKYDSTFRARRFDGVNLHAIQVTRPFMWSGVFSYRLFRARV